MQMAEIELGVHGGNAAGYRGLLCTLHEYATRYFNYVERRWHCHQIFSLFNGIAPHTSVLCCVIVDKLKFVVYYGLPALITATLVCKSGIISYKLYRLLL